MSTIPNRRPKKPPPLCPNGHALMFRPWFTDCNGFVHHAIAHGKRVWVWCPVCDGGGPFRRRSPVARKPKPPRRPPPSADGAKPPRVRKRRG